MFDTGRTLCPHSAEPDGICQGQGFNLCRPMTITITVSLHIHPPGSIQGLTDRQAPQHLKETEQREREGEWEGDREQNRMKQKT